MRTRFKVLTILVAFIAGFGSGVGLKTAYEAISSKPYYWKSPPIIVNCYGEDFSEPQLVRAISYWTLRGQSIGFYEHKPSKKTCENEWLEGFIILRRSDLLDRDESTLANTRRYTSLTRMKGAVINYTPGAQNLDMINEHELGHALGFSHVEVVGNIMHPLYHKMGRDFLLPTE